MSRKIKDNVKKAGAAVFLLYMLVLIYFLFFAESYGRIPYEKRELLRSGLLGFMPQTGGLIPYLTVFDNIKLQVQVALKQRATLQKELKGNSILTKDRVRDLLENSKTLAKDFGIDGPVISASSIAVFKPLLAALTASIEVTSDLPTPPLPPVTVITFTRL